MEHSTNCSGSLNKRGASAPADQRSKYNFQESVSWTTQFNQLQICAQYFAVLFS